MTSSIDRWGYTMTIGFSDASGRGVLAGTRPGAVEGVGGSSRPGGAPRLPLVTVRSAGGQPGADLVHPPDHATPDADGRG